LTPFLHGVARATAEAFDLPGPVLEVGAFQVEGQEALANLRPFFAGKSYLGVDQRAGPGVDELADVENLPYADGSFGTVLALSTFEHVAHFWRGFEEVRRVLRPDGALLVACPFYFHVHDEPCDYWRFTPAALEVLLEDYPGKVIGWHGPESRPANVWAVAFREEAPALTAADHARYQGLLRRHARMPLPWAKKVRLNLGRALFGGGYFAPHLERERWQTRLCTTHFAPQPQPARQAACV
jgi:SAM-dependent methyltransferase